MKKLLKKLFKTKDRDVVKRLEHLRDVQSDSLVDGYMVGLYNGIEHSLAILEKREPEYRENTFPSFEAKRKSPPTSECIEVKNTYIKKKIRLKEIARELSCLYFAIGMLMSIGSLKYLKEQDKTKQLIAERDRLEAEIEAMENGYEI